MSKLNTISQTYDIGDFFSSCVEEKMFFIFSNVHLPTAARHASSHSAELGIHSDTLGKKWACLVVVRLNRRYNRMIPGGRSQVRGNGTVG